ncbi:MAG: O-antigen ligase family protein, partial [Anaerolineales bacterium]
VMVVLVPLAIDRLVSERNPWAKAIAGWALAASALTVIFTFSRGGFLALIMVTMLIMWRQRPPIMAVLVVLAIGIALLPLLPAQYTARLGTLLDFLPTNQTSSQNDVSFRGRTNEYAVGLLMFRDNPILGVGMENYPTEYLRYSRLVGLDPRRENRSPHSLYVEIAAERGIVGLSVFAFLIGVVFYSIGKAREMLTSAHQPGSASLVIAVGVGLAGYLTSALFIHASYPRHFWLLIGVALALPRMAQNELQEFRALKAWLQKRNKKASQLRSRRPPTDLGGVKLT